MTSLQGKRILVSRNAEEQEETAAQIREFGGIPIPCPVISIQLPSDTEPLDTAIRELSTFDWLIFTSANSVRFFIKRVHDLAMDITQLEKVKKAVIGPKTKRQLESHHFSTDFTAARATGKEFLEEFCCSHSIAGKQFLLPLSNIAHRTVPEGLRQNNGFVTEVVAYCNEAVTELPQEIIRQLKYKEIGWVLFTSSSTVRNFFNCLQHEPEAREGVKAASIGPSTSATLREYGIEPHTEAQEHTLHGLLHAMGKNE